MRHFSCVSSPDHKLFRHLVLLSNSDLSLLTNKTNFFYSSLFFCQLTNSNLYGGR